MTTFCSIVLKIFVVTFVTLMLCPDLLACSLRNNLSNLELGGETKARVSSHLHLDIYSSQTLVLSLPNGRQAWGHTRSLWVSVGSGCIILYSATVANLSYGFFEILVSVSVKIVNQVLSFSSKYKLSYPTASYFTFKLSCQLGREGAREREIERAWKLLTEEPKMANHWRSTKLQFVSDT